MKGRIGQAVLLAVLAALVWSLSAAAAPATGGSPVRSYPVDSNAGVNGITVGPDGRLWFTEDIGRVGHITTAGVHRQFKLPTFSVPLGITSADGDLWVAGGGSVGRTDRVSGGQIMRITTSGKVTLFKAQGQRLPYDVAAGPDGTVWVTDEPSMTAASGGAIERLDANGQSTVFTGVSDPHSITAGPDGNLWFVDGNAVGRITPAGQITEFPLQKGVIPLDITAGPDGALWVAADTSGAAEHGVIERVTTSGALHLFTTPAADATAITSGPDHALWFADDSRNSLWRITTGGAITRLPVRGEVKDLVTGPDHALWLAFDDSIARVVPSRCVVPNLVGLRVEAARHKLTAAHCPAPAVQRKPRSHARSGNVISQHPGASVQLPVGAAVRLAVAG